MSVKGFWKQPIIQFKTIAAVAFAFSRLAICPPNTIEKYLVIFIIGTAAADIVKVYITGGGTGFIIDPGGKR